jgi:glycosyltransferase involved in cell wall biosynthesis
MLRIVTIYARDPTVEDAERGALAPLSMAYIRWFKISEKLARRGYDVDMAIPDRLTQPPAAPERLNARQPRRVPLSQVDWSRYDVVKTLFHRGFETLEAYGGSGHPFIISKLGSVVGPRDMDGIYFYGAARERLYSTQVKIQRTSKYVTLLSPAAQALWTACYGSSDNTLLVPGGVDQDIPAPATDPYPEDGKVRVLFAGNVYSRDAQPEANAILIDKLNRLGRHLSGRGAQLFVIGVGDFGALDRELVTYQGAIEYDRSWDYFHHADVGVVVAAGAFTHNNESTKIYHYLRAGLPVVSEAGFPNDHVVVESGLGCVVDSGDMELMAQAVVEAARREWNRERSIRYILEHHTWEKRVEEYGELFRRHFGE